MQQSDIEQQLGPFNAITPIGATSGSGECWRLEDGSSVKALKVIVKDPEPERFEREVQALERVNSPLVMNVLAYGDDLVAASDGNAYRYHVSDFIDGGNVREHLNSGRIPNDDELRAFLKAIIGGLEVLHGAEIVHRDIKPENVVLRGGDWSSPVIVDLGLSRLMDMSSLTIYPWAAGTWPYMAPEQLRGERAIDRTDLWALAIMAGELAEGRHPFFHGAGHLPADWEPLLLTGIQIPGSRPAGLRDLVGEAGQFAAYRRPTAQQAASLLEEVWPVRNP